MDDNTWTFSQSFTPEFQAMRSELFSRIEAINSQGLPSEDSLKGLSVSLAKMTKALGDATGRIPSYDQKQFENQLKALEIAIESLRNSAPKAKFTFKRNPQPRVPPVPLSPMPLTTTSQSAGNAESSFPTTSNSVNISSQSNQYIAQLSFDCAKTDLTISALDHCVVDLLEGSRTTEHELKLSALHVRSVTRSILLLPPVAGSALLQDLTDCTVVIRCHQFRMHSSKNVNVFLSISSDPIIEHCEGIRFGRYPPSLTSAALTEQTSFNIKDFSHIRSTPSPNFSVMLDEDMNTMDSKLSCLKDRRNLLAEISHFLPEP